MEKSSVARGKVHIAALMKVAAGALCVVLLLQIGCNAMLTDQLRRNAVEQMESMASYFMDEMDGQLDGIYRELRELVMLNESNVRRLGSLAKEMDILTARRAIYSDLTNMQDRYGYDIGVFIYDKESGKFYHGSTEGWELRDYNRVTAGLMLHLLMGEDEAEPQGRNWSTFECDEGSYVYGYESYLGYYACAVIPEESFMRPQQYVRDSEEMLMSLLPAGVDQKEEGREWLRGLEKEGYHVQLMKQRNADFDIVIGIRDSGTVRSLMAWQLAAWVAVVIMSLLMLTVFWFTKKKVIEPLEYFSGNLVRYQESEGESYFEDSRIYELEEANELFRRNLASMRELKIRMYEETLQKQRLEMEYTKLQINPHFYINCMNQIYNMACLEDYENIRTMAKNISDYFRYIFQKKSDYVELTQELEHIRTYLDMCRFRYGSNFAYEVEITHDVSDVKIPPLLLHTFVENSLKYGMNRSHMDVGPQGNYIGVHVERVPVDGKDLVTIEVSDNGDGFPQELLDRLQGQELDVAADGTKVGIRNAIYRLGYLYHGEARLNFFNREGFGAVIKLCIPVEGGQEENGAVSGHIKGEVAKNENSIGG